MKLSAEEIINILQNIGSDSFTSKSILVTGGAGFLGSWLCDVFSKNNADITCLDNLSTGLLSNIEHLKTSQKFAFVNSNVDDPIKTSKKFDIIIHMASRPSPDDYVKFPVSTLNANSKGTYNILELARKFDSTVLFASTSEVYGDSQIIPTPETYWGNVNPIGIRSCYDEGKRFSESLLMAYNRQYGIDTRIVRIFNTYGPRIRADGAYGRALPRFILQALKNEKITIHGDGLQTRSFCYVTDTVEAILKCVLNKKTTTPINVGNQQETTIIDLAKQIVAKCNSKSQIIHLQRPPDDPQRRCPDITLANTVLNWKPQITLEHGLEKTITWFKNRI